MFHVPKYSHSSPSNLLSPPSSLISVTVNSTLLVGQTKGSLQFLVIPLSHLTSNPAANTADLLSNYILNLTASHHFHWCHLGSLHSHLPPGWILAPGWSLLAGLPIFTIAPSDVCGDQSDSRKMEVRSCHYSARKFPTGPTTPWVNGRVLTWPGSSLPSWLQVLALSPPTPATAASLRMPDLSNLKGFSFIVSFWNGTAPCNIHVLWSLASIRSSPNVTFSGEGPSWSTLARQPSPQCPESLFLCFFFPPEQHHPTTPLSYISCLPSLKYKLLQGQKIYLLCSLQDPDPQQFPEHDRNSVNSCTFDKHSLEVFGG